MQRSALIYSLAAAGLVTVLGLAVQSARETTRLSTRPVESERAPVATHFVSELSRPIAPSRSAAGPIDVTDTMVRRCATNALLTELSAELEARDERAAQIVETFLARGAPAIDDLLASLGDRSIELGNADAIGVLVKAALLTMALDPDLLAPWRAEHLVEQCLASIGASVHAPRALLVGLDEYGPRAEPKHVLALVDAFVNDEVDGAFEAQVPCLGLARHWAESASPAVEEALTQAFAETAATDSRRAQVAGLLLARDWRRFGPELAEGLASRLEAAAASGDTIEANETELVLAARIIDVPPMERGDYFAMFSENAGLAVAMAWNLEKEDAQQVLASGPSAELEGDARDLLEVRAGGDAALESGRRLIAPDRASDSMERLVIGSWLASDLALGEELVAVLTPRFEARGGDGGRFWRALGHDLGARQDHEIVAGVLPWLERSRGERDPGRERVLRAVRTRLRDPRIE